MVESAVGGFDYFLIVITNIGYYVAIGLQLLNIVFVLNRLVSPKVKKIIDTLQVLGLISLYRFRQEEVAERALKTANVFNFSYFSQLICDQQAIPYGCSTFQNLIGPGLTLLAFILLFLLSYILANCIYFGTKNEDNGIIYIR